MLANKDVTFCCYMDRFVCCSGCPRLKFWKRLGNLVSIWFMSYRIYGARKHYAQTGNEKSGFA